MGAFHLVLSVVLTSLVAGAAIAQSDANPDYLARQIIELRKAGVHDDEAIGLAKRYAEVMKVQRGPEHPSYAAALTDLAELLRLTNRFGEAEPLLRHALSINEASSDPDGYNTAKTLHELAQLLQASNRFAEAEPLVRRADAIMEVIVLGPHHPRFVDALLKLAAVLGEDGKWEQAVRVYGRAKAILLWHTDSDNQQSRYVLGWNSEPLRAHARALHRGNPESSSAREEGFELAQWALQTVAADALAQLSVRFAKGAGQLATLIRMRQDLLVSIRKLEQELGLADPVLRAPKKNFDAINARLASEFKEYAEFSMPRPLDLAATQALLRADEVLILLLDVPRMGTVQEETLVWAVTKADARWARTKLGGEALAERVFALRCGLDARSWDDAHDWPEMTEEQVRQRSAQIARRQQCERLLGTKPATELVAVAPVQVLPFDVTRAHELYQALLGPVEDMIQGKHLIVVPSGPLTSLPFSVLVTRPPQTTIPADLAGYRNVAWLGARQPITVLPSVASLKGLREFAKRSRATKAYLGIGNPLLEGPQHDMRWGAYYKSQADLALTKRCSTTSGAHASWPRGPRPIRSFASVFRGAQADIDQVRLWTPLPETADELCEVGQRLAVTESKILLGTHATEAKLKELSEQGRLADYAILHFATHGALTGQVEGAAEPGLILTPPPKGTAEPQALERDDGFLTASEIATLKLDADWVILSACNTAGAAKQNAETLSGMARAFFYAGARALLVSHWEVDSAATVALITNTMRAVARDLRLSRSEALHHAMLGLIKEGSVARAHPAYWAPFVVVGEGAQ